MRILCLTAIAVVLMIVCTLDFAAAGNCPGGVCPLGRRSARFSGGYGGAYSHGYESTRTHVSLFGRHTRVKHRHHHHQSP